jgi:hypothetical protein
MSVSSMIVEREASARTLFSDKAIRLFILRGMLSPIVSTRWARFIRRYHRAFEAAPPPARVLGKPVRSYVHTRLGPSARLAMLRTHYRLLRDLFSPDCVRRLCSGEPTQIVELEARKGARYQVVVVASVRVWMQREGELAFYLIKRGSQSPVSRLSLTFGQVSGRRAVMIGGLQGPGEGHKRDVIEATRELHGLRPKDATLLAARALANALGMGAVHAIANRHHVLHRLEDRSKHADYDSYWAERGAAPGGPLGFVFAPLEPALPTVNSRGAMKAAIVAGVEGFAREQGRRGREAAADVASAA